MGQFKKPGNVKTQEKNVQDCKKNVEVALEVDKISCGPTHSKNLQIHRVSSQKPHTKILKPTIQNEASKSWLSVVQSNVVKIKLEEDFPRLPGAKPDVKSKTNVSSESNRNIEKPLAQNISNSSKPETEEAFKTENSGSTMKKKKKSQPPLKATIQPQRNPYKKKRSEPLYLNLKETFDINTAKKKKQPKLFKSNFQRHVNKEHVSGNILDASNPIRYKGKHRERKKKKLSNLKLVIIKERIIKQKMKENSVTNFFGTEYEDLVKSLDFKVEIEKYLKQLEEKKINTVLKNGKKVKEGTSLINKTETDLKIDEELKTGSDVGFSKVKDIKNESDNITNKKNVAAKEIKNKSSHERSHVTEKPNSDSRITKTNEDEVVDLLTSDNKTVTSPPVKQLKFSSKLREYCDNLITPALNLEVSELIKEIVNLQDKMFARDPIKAKARKRHVSGFREVKKFLLLKKVKMLIISPDLEKLQMQGGVYDLVNECKSVAESQNVPYVFALDRNKLGRCARKKVPVSIFGILSYEGVESRFENVLQLLKSAKEEFSNILSKSEEKTEDKNENIDVNAKIISSLISELCKDLSVSNNNDISEED